MKISFPYLDRGGKFYPVIDIEIFGKKSSLLVKALIDSGASFSVFRSEIADYLGISIEKGKPVYLEGVGGRILGYLHTVPVAVGRKKFHCKIIFSKEFMVSFNLLGRDNFFERFVITFNEKRRETILS
ncbi:MAG: retropepsin-like aspartic protease [Patescibacteria group bacterium]